MKWVTDQPAWKRSEGRDHIFPIHHPWSFKSVRKFVKNAIWLLPDMDSTGNWYKPGQVSLEKDLILPYVPNVDICDTKCLSESAPMRTTLLFFRGRLKRNAVRVMPLLIYHFTSYIKCSCLFLCRWLLGFPIIVGILCLLYKNNWNTSLYWESSQSTFAFSYNFVSHDLVAEFVLGG